MEERGSAGGRVSEEGKSAVAKPVSPNHLLSVCLLSALFSLSQESNGFSTVRCPNLHHQAPTPALCSLLFPLSSFSSLPL